MTGFARGNPFNANRLVHLQSFGDFQIDQITTAPKDSNKNNDMEEDEQVADKPVPGEQDDLVAENEPDFMENEQTWPTEEELAAGEGKLLVYLKKKSNRTVRRMLTGEYHAFL